LQIPWGPYFHFWLIICPLSVFIYLIKVVWHIISVSDSVFTSIILTFDFSNLASSITVVDGVPVDVSQIHVDCAYNAPYLMFHIAERNQLSGYH
jgi:hypothetical protein